MSNTPKQTILNRLNSLRQQRGEEGFTLIELLVVILIIGILAAIALPIFMNQQAEAAKAAVKSDVRSTTTATQEALLSGGFGQLTSDADGNILVDGVPTTADVVASDGVTVAVLADDSTTETSDYLVTGSSEGSGDYAYIFTSRTGTYADGTAAAAGGSGTADLGPYDYSGLDPWADDDGDGIDNYTEQSYTTNPRSADSDGDGYSDPDELNSYGGDAMNPSVYPAVIGDTGGDGNPDNDADGFTDSEEATAGTDPYNGSSYPGSTPPQNNAAADSDGDGYSDSDENNAGTDPYNGSDYPGSIPSGGSGDSDGDGISDADESMFGTDPSNADSDGDGTDDYNDMAPTDPDVA